MATIGVLITAPPKGGDPFTPFCRLELKQISTSSLEEIRLPITPQLMTDSEVDYQVDALIGELQNARRKTKRRLKKAREELEADPRARH